MATDERNFRSTYYEKVGFRSVEEKKSLEILLKDKPLDKVKLKQFCLRFSVPGTYRNLLWKLLLGIVPVHIDSHHFVMSQRQQEYNDLIHALQILRLIDGNTTKPQIFFTMWLLQTGKLKYDTNIQINHGFIAIAQSLLQIFEDDTDVYWMTKGFYSIVEQFKQDIPKLVDRTIILLEKEDLKLYKHLKDIKVLHLLPFTTWFDCSFAGVINETALAKIWDKLCGGSCKILVFVIIVTLTTLRHCLLKCNDYDSVIQYLDTISEETAEVIANKAIELWQQYGSSLTVQDNPQAKNKNS